MNTITRISPPTVLLATDLGARCDRALERAVQIAAQWKARLVIACVLPPLAGHELREEVLGQPSWGPSRDPETYARRELERELGRLPDGIDVRLRLEEGEIGPTVYRVASEENCGLIITGLANDAIFETPRIGSTVNWLARNSHLPLLLVRHRAHGPYRTMALACDFTAACASALVTSLNLFSEPLQLSLVHGLSIPKAGLRDTDTATLEALAINDVQTRARHFLADGSWSLDLSQRTDVVIETGDAARVVGSFVRDHDVDLMVVGSHGRSTLSALLLGSHAQRLVAAAATDTLLVRSMPAGTSS